VQCDQNTTLHPRSFRGGVTKRGQQALPGSGARQHWVGLPGGGYWRGIIAALWIVSFAATMPGRSGAGSGPVTYAYDELGRLVAVVDGVGNAAQYNYDAVGNLKSITIPTGPVSIFTFTPNNGPVNTTTVTIYGDGFSTTPSQNTVTFYNGKNVTPTAPTTIATITVPVPTGATTGPIKVTVGTNSATSPENFKVTAN